MAKIELLCGEGIENAFRELGISSKRTYKRSPTPDDGQYHGEDFEVWEIEQSDMDELETVPEDNWKDDWGFWRWSSGCVLGTPHDKFIVNGNEMTGWDGSKRIDIAQDWEEEPEEEKSAYEGGFDEYVETWNPRKYADLLEYLCGEHSVSTEKNICALSVDLAKANGMTLAGLFEKYLP